MLTAVLCLAGGLLVGVRLGQIARDDAVRQAAADARKDGFAEGVAAASAGQGNSAEQLKGAKGC